jgi:hypothetical protein
MSAGGKPLIHLPRIVIAALGALALSACGSEPEQATGPVAASKVLEGSTSDAMIPYERLRSEPPAAKIETDEADGGSGKGPTGNAATGAAASVVQGEAAGAAPDSGATPEPSE